MIGKLTGQFDAGAGDGLVTIEVKGVGYLVRMPLTAMQTLRSSNGFGTNPEISLFIHTAVREDAIDLYGFSTQEELGFFKLLMSVSGIGPKSALGILNVADVVTLKRGIAAGDAASLTKVFGIGKKSAERIVVELRDKLSREAESTPSAVGAKSSDDFEVVEALMALGYTAHESRNALKTISGEGLRERLSSALKILGRRTVVS